MTDADRHVMTVFTGALDRDSGPERAAYLDEACGADAALRERVEALLRAHEQVGGFLEPRGTVAFGSTSPAVEPANPLAGSVIAGRYKLIEEIGEGGMGTVWMAQQTEPVKRAVAVKLIKPGMDSRQVLARFEAERQALALMDHPNIARVLDGGATESGRPFFVMELVKGVAMTKYCDEHRLTPRQRLELFVPVCQAVQHAHQKGIIHRDIKPSNILVAQYDGRPVPKVIDFGVAKAAGQQLTDKTLMTGFGAVVGTLEYMSPEQAELNQLDIDTRSDIYSLGVVLYELLTGTTPLERRRLKRAALLEALRIIREEEPPRPSTRLSTTEKLPAIAAARGLEPRKLSGLVRGELDWVVMKCLEKDRGRRYETANGLARDLERYLADEPVQACPPSAGYRLRKFARRHKAALAAAAAVVGALVVAVVALAVSNVRVRQESGHKEEALREKGEALAAAKANALEARRAVDEMYTGVAKEWLAHQPQMEPKQRKFLKKALDFYERFAEESGPDPAVRFEKARAYFRVAEIQYRLGEPAQAEGAYKQAISLLQALVDDFPDGAEYQSELADVLNSYGVFLGDTNRYPEEGEAHRSAVVLQKKLVADFPAEASYRHHLARGLFFLGDMERPSKERDEFLVQAIALQRKLVDEFPSEPDYRAYLAESLYKLGLLRWNTKRDEGARPLLQSAVDLMEKLTADFPTHPEYRDRLGESRCYLARTLAYPESEKEFQRAIAVQEKLVADFPSVTSRRYDLVRSYHYLGAHLASLHKADAAEKAYRKGLATGEPLVAVPKVYYFRAKMADVHTELGNLLITSNRLPDAVKEYQQAIALHEKLAAAHPQEPGFRDGLARSRYNLATLLQEIGQKKEAAKAFREAIAIWEKLANAFPANTEYPQHVTYCFGQLTALLTSDGQREEAIKCCEEQIAFCQELDDQALAKAEVRERLQQAYHSLGLAQRSFGRHEQAVESFSKAAAVVEKLVRDFPNEARYSEWLYYAHAELASTFISARRFREAEKFYGEAIQLNPNDAMLWLRLADFYGRLGLWDLAARDSATAFKLQPPATPHLCISHAVLCLHIGDLASYRQLGGLMQTRFHQDKGYVGWEYELSRASTIAAPPEANLAWAVQQAEKGVQRNRNVWTYWALGRANFRAGEYEQAVSHLKRSLELDANWNGGGLTYPVLAMAYHHLGQGKKAKEALEKEGRVIEQGWDVLARGPVGTLTMVWWQDWLESCLLYREAKTLIDGQPPPDDPRWHVTRANAFAALGDEQKAAEARRQVAEAYGQAIKLRPTDPEPRLHRSEYYIRSGASDLAAKDATELMKLEAAQAPKKPEIRQRWQKAYRSLGVALRSGGRRQEAVQALSRSAAIIEKLVCDFPYDATYADDLYQVHRELAETFIAEKRFAEGEKLYSEAIKLQPDNAMLWLRRAEFYSRLGLWDLAAKDTVAAFKLQPPATTMQSLSLALLSLYVGDLNSYRQVCAWLPKRFRQEHAWGSELPRACTIVATPEADLAWAVQQAEIGVKTNPTPWHYSALGRALFRAGNYEQAIAEIEQSLKLDPNWCWGGLNYPVLAMAYHRLSREKKGKEALEKASRAIELGSDVLARGPAGTLPMAWWDWLECCQLFREAKIMIDGQPPADDPRWHVARALAFAALGDQQKAAEAQRQAAEAYGQAIKLKPEDPILRVGRAQYYIQSGALDLAAKDVAELMKVEAVHAPQETEGRQRWQKAYHDLGVALRSASRHQEAVQSLSRAAALAEKLSRDFPNDVSYADQLFHAHRELAATFIATRRLGEGEKFYSEAIKLQPNDAMLWRRRADFYARLGLWDLATKDSAAAFKVEPPVTPNQCLSLAVLSLYAGDLASYRQLCALIPKRFGRDTDYGGWDSELTRACTIGSAPEAGVLAWAVQRAERGVKRDDAPPWNYATLGRAYFRSGDYEQAVTQLKQALTYQLPFSWKALTYSVLAMAYHRLGKAEQAKKALGEAGRAMDQLSDGLLRDPADNLALTSFWNNWVEFYLLYREARTLIDGSPPADDPRWHMARAVAFTALGDQKKATESYSKAVELGATEEQRGRFIKSCVDQAWNSINANPRRLEEAEKLCRQGIETVQKILARSPDAVQESWQLADLHCALGWAFQHGSKPAAAAKAFEKEIHLREELLPKLGGKREQRWDLCQAYTFLGLALESAGRLEESVKTDRRALAATEQLAADFPKEPIYQRQLAICHRNLGVMLLKTARADEAELHFRKLLTICEEHPDLPDAADLRVQSLFGLAQVLVKSGRHEDAGKTYLRLVELKPASAMGNNNAAWFLATCADAKFRNPARAVEMAKKATELVPQEGTNWNTLGAAQYRAGDWKAAIAALEKSMDLRKGGDSFDWFFLAMARWQLGDKEKARTWFDKAVQWMDKNQPADEELGRFRAEAAGLLGIKDGRK
jgi:tetratricopeptide (TPR) repeat protein/serine/threonine protein kinase